MSYALITKLKLFERLSAEDEAVLADALSKPKHVRAGTPLAVRGTPPLYFHAIHEGFACRSVMPCRDRRQILKVMVPGDSCDPRIFMNDRMGFSIQALTDCTVSTISQAEVSMLMRRTTIASALTQAGLADGALLMQRLVSLGRRDPAERIAHFFCEFRLRLAAIGRAPDGPIDFPLTSQDLADAMGLSIVATNRAMQQLRAEGLIATTSRTLDILDPIGLEDRGLFSADHLPFHAAAAGSGPPDHDGGFRSRLA